MALREDLLTPVAGENPSGTNLYYDQIFEQIKEARREDSDDLPEGDWERAAKKKADFRQVIKLAGDALVKRTKDLRLAGWLMEAYLRTEGIAVLVPSIEFLHSLQEIFWDTIYPIPEDDGDLELRAVSVETAAKLINAAARKIPFTRSGLTYEGYLESRLVGYEQNATTDAKREAREDAINRGKLTGEDFDQAFAASPKSLYVEIESALSASLVAIDRLDEFHQEKYGNNTPDLSRLKDGLGEMQRAAEFLLNERRKTEPEPKQDAEKLTTISEDGTAETHAIAHGLEKPATQASAYDPSAVGPLSRVEDAYAAIVAGAEFLFEQDPSSPIPYLVCSGLRFGETRMQSSSPAPGFAVSPSLDARRSLRALANSGAWAELLRSSLRILAGESARCWLDLHRYVWRAGQETGAEAVSLAVVGTVKSLLMVQPELRYWTLEDDTGAANPETQQWLDSVVLS
jgi:type VI secretion system protein ImpA